MAELAADPSPYPPPYQETCPLLSRSPRRHTERLLYPFWEGAQAGRGQPLQPDSQDDRRSHGSSRERGSLDSVARQS